MSNMNLLVSCVGNTHDISIEEITLLTQKEFDEMKDRIPEDPRVSLWWLQSPGKTEKDVCVASNYNKVITHGFHIGAKLGVRPALRLQSSVSNPGVGKRFLVGRRWYTMIGEDLALADRAICEMPFRKDAHADNANQYSVSDVKKYLAEYARMLDTLIWPYDAALFVKKGTDGLTGDELNCLYRLMDDYGYWGDATCLPICIRGEKGLSAVGLITDSAAEELGQYDPGTAFHEFIEQQLLKRTESVTESSRTFKFTAIDHDIALSAWNQGLRIWLGE